MLAIMTREVKKGGPLFLSLLGMKFKITRIAFHYFGRAVLVLLEKINQPLIKDTINEFVAQYLQGQGRTKGIEREHNPHHLEMAFDPGDKITALQGQAQLFKADPLAAHKADLVRIHLNIF